MQRKIIIAPHSAKRFILSSFRKNNPFVDVKLYTKEELISKYYGEYNDDAVIYLLNHFDLEYDLVKKILSNLRFVKDYTGNNPKIKLLKEYRNELISHNLLSVDNLLKYELSNSDIEVFYYSKDDKMLQSIIGNYSPTYHFVCPNDKVLMPNHFIEAEDEIYYVVSQIGSLISSGISPNKILIYNINNQYKNILERSLKNCGININGLNQKSFASLPYVREFLADYFLKDEETLLKEINEKYQEEKDENFDTFSELISKFKIAKFDKNKQYHLYDEIFSNKVVKEEPYLEAIKVVDEPLANDDEYLFILNFVSGTFPSLIRDDDYLSDLDKKELNIATSREENFAKTQQFKGYLLQKCHLFISYSDTCYNTSYHPHYFLKLFADPKNIALNPEVRTIYSKKEGLLKYGNLLDIERKYLKISDELKAYQNSYKNVLDYNQFLPKFTTINSYKEPQQIKLSYSALNKFNGCKFKYYLDYVLRLTPTLDNIHINFGNYAHFIFQHINEGSFEELSKLALKNWTNISPKEKILLRRLNKELKERFDSTKEFEKQLNNPSIYREEEISINVDDFIITGKIDKLISAGPDNNYISIIDYKTGSESFKESLLKVGQSMQLPTYALLARQSESFKDKELSGIYIQHLEPKKIIHSKKSEKKDELKYKKLDGVFCNDAKILSYFDKGVLDLSPNYLTARIKEEKNGEVLVPNGQDESWFTIKADLALKSFIEMRKTIKNGNFEIRPKKLGKNTFDACEYCPYKDVCYRDDDQYEYFESDRKGKQDE